MCAPSKRRFAVHKVLKRPGVDQRHVEHRPRNLLAKRRIRDKRVGCIGMKLLYKPFAIIAALIGAKLGQAAFKRLWSKIDDAAPPIATGPEGSLPKIVGARALEAATMAGAVAVVERVSARTFHHFTGVWPGERAQQRDQH
jgi:hypothetical protein